VFYDPTAITFYISPSDSFQAPYELRCDCAAHAKAKFGELSQILFSQSFCLDSMGDAVTGAAPVAPLSVHELKPSAQLA